MFKAVDSVIRRCEPDAGFPPEAHHKTPHRKTRRRCGQLQASGSSSRIHVYVDHQATNPAIDNPQNCDRFLFSPGGRRVAVVRNGVVVDLRQPVKSGVKSAVGLVTPDRRLVLSPEHLDP